MVKRYLMKKVIKRFGSKKAMSSAQKAALKKAVAASARKRAARAGVKAAKRKVQVQSFRKGWNRTLSRQRARIGAKIKSKNKLAASLSKQAKSLKKSNPIKASKMNYKSAKVANQSARLSKRYAKLANINDKQAAKEMKTISRTFNTTFYGLLGANVGANLYAQQKYKARQEKDS